jgi:hypothetical protein
MDLTKIVKTLNELALPDAAERWEITVLPAVVKITAYTRSTWSTRSAATAAADELAAALGADALDVVKLLTGPVNYVEFGPGVWRGHLVLTVRVPEAGATT